jgi:hypothetical protein
MPRLSPAQFVTVRKVIEGASRSRVIAGLSFGLALLIASLAVVPSAAQVALTATPTATATATGVVTPTVVLTSTATASATPTPTATSTLTPIATPARTPSALTPLATPAPTATSTLTPLTTPASTPSATVTARPTPTVETTPRPRPTATPRATRSLLGVRRNDTKYDTALLELTRATEALADGGVAPSANGARQLSDKVEAAVSQKRMRFTGDDIQVYVEWSGAAAVQNDALRALGAVVESEDSAQAITQVRVQVSRLAEIAALAGVKHIRLPDYPIAQVGSKTTQGDALLRLNTLRTSSSVDGTGITVGVIADGLAGLQAAIGLGDLPATTETRIGGVLTATSGGVIGRSFPLNSNLEAGAEGTALLEVIHDIAPGAQLRFASASTALNFNDAVNFLAPLCDVVIDDLSFVIGPLDGTDVVSTNTSAALNNASNAIRTHVTAAGNFGDAHYEGVYVSSGMDSGEPGDFHLFQATADTANGGGPVGGSVNNPFVLQAGASVAVYLLWADPWHTSSNDYDLLVGYDDAGSEVIVASSTQTQDGDDNPFESVAFTNTSGAELEFDIFIVNFANAAAAKTLDVFVSGSVTRAYAGGAKLGWLTPKSSVVAEGNAGGGVLSVGAINASDPGLDDIEVYSSRGPTLDGRVKPDISAIDGVAVTGSGGFSTSFFGTSAAAAHVAGVAALLMERHPRLRSGATSAVSASEARTILRGIITSSAVDLGVAGSDNVYGAGRVDGVNALAIGGPAASLAFNTQPGAGTARGIALTTQPTVRALDSYEHVAALATVGSVALSIKGGTGTAGATLGSTTSQSTVNGVATFSGLSVSKSGTGYVLVATSGGLVVGESAAFNVAAGSAAAVAAQTQPAGATADTAFTTQPTFQIRDSDGTQTTGTNAVTVAIKPGTGTSGAVLSGTTTVNAVNGVATFTNLKIDRTGSGFVLTASAAGLTSVDSSAFAVAAAAPPAPAPSPASDGGGGGAGEGDASSRTLILVEHGEVPVEVHLPDITRIDIGGAQVTSDTSFASLTVTVPPNALPSRTELLAAVVANPRDLAGEAPPPVGSQIAAGFVVKANDATGQPLISPFERAVDLSFSIVGSLVPPGTELNQLALAFWNGSLWTVVPAAFAPNPDGSITVRVATTHFTLFAVLYADGSAPRPPTPALRDASHVVALSTGWSLVIWTGPDNAPVADAVKQVISSRPDGVASVWRVDDKGEFEGYLIGAPDVAQAGLKALRRGAPYIIGMRVPGSWSMPAG